MNIEQVIYEILELSDKKNILDEVKELLLYINSEIKNSPPIDYSSYFCFYVNKILKLLKNDEIEKLKEILNRFKYYSIIHQNNLYSQDLSTTSYMCNLYLFLDMADSNIDYDIFKMRMEEAKQPIFRKISIDNIKALTEINNIYNNEFIYKEFLKTIYRGLNFNNSDLDNITSIINGILRDKAYLEKNCNNYDLESFEKIINELLTESSYYIPIIKLNYDKFLMLEKRYDYFLTKLSEIEEDKKIRYLLFKKVRNIFNIEYFEKLNKSDPEQTKDYFKLVIDRIFCSSYTYYELIQKINRISQAIIDDYDTKKIKELLDEFLTDKYMFIYDGQKIGINNNINNQVEIPTTMEKRVRLCFELYEPNCRYSVPRYFDDNLADYEKGYIYEIEKYRENEKKKQEEKKVEERMLEILKELRELYDETSFKEISIKLNDFRSFDTKDYELVINKYNIYIVGKKLYLPIKEYVEYPPIFLPTTDFSITKAFVSNYDAIKRQLQLKISRMKLEMEKDSIEEKTISEESSEEKLSAVDSNETTSSEVKKKKKNLFGHIW